MRSLKIFSALPALLLTFSVLAVNPVFAASTCVFKTVGTTTYLKGDCTTDTAITVPGGGTFMGGSFSISSVDPVGGHFVGPILKLTDANAVITNLTLNLNLGSSCEANDANRRIGLLIDGAKNALVTKLNVIVSRDAGNTCEDGIGIDYVNAFPAPGIVPVPVVSTLKANILIGAHWIGIRLRGNLNIRLDSNKITGDATAAILAQTGVKITENALGYLVKNSILYHGRQNPYKLTPGVGIALDGAATKTNIDSNTVQFDDIGIQLIGANTLTIAKNKVTNCKRAGILLQDGAAGSPINQNNNIITNTVQKNRNGIEILSPSLLATNNLIKTNSIDRSTQVGIVGGGTANKIQKNISIDNLVLDIQNLGGVSMSYSGNTCNLSSGSPVDCPKP